MGAPRWNWIWGFKTPQVSADSESGCRAGGRSAARSLAPGRAHSIDHSKHLHGGDGATAFNLSRARDVHRDGDVGDIRSIIRYPSSDSDPAVTTGNSTNVTKALKDCQKRDASDGDGLIIFSREFSENLLTSVGGTRSAEHLGVCSLLRQSVFDTACRELWRMALARSSALRYFNSSFPEPPQDDSLAALAVVSCDRAQENFSNQNRCCCSIYSSQAKLHRLEGVKANGLMNNDLQLKQSIFSQKQSDPPAQRRGGVHAGYPISHARGSGVMSSNVELNQSIFSQKYSDPPAHCRGGVYVGQPDSLAGGKDHASVGGNDEESKITGSCEHRNVPHHGAILACNAGIDADCHTKTAAAADPTSAAHIFEVKYERGCRAPSLFRADSSGTAFHFASAMLSLMTSFASESLLCFLVVLRYCWSRLQRRATPHVSQSGSNCPPLLSSSRLRTTLVPANQFLAHWHSSLRRAPAVLDLAMQRRQPTLHRQNTEWRSIRKPYSTALPLLPLLLFLVSLISVQGVLSITGAAEANGPKTGGVTVTITGSGIASDAVARLGGTTCTTTLWMSANEITCVIAAGSMQGAAVVVTEGNACRCRIDTFADAFSFDGPTVTDAAATNAPMEGGTTLTLLGGNLATYDVSLKAAIQGTGAELSRWVADTALVCKIALGTGRSLTATVSV
eukprot:2707403-Rhodomonas_salina.1